MSAKAILSRSVAVAAVLGTALGGLPERRLVPAASAQSSTAICKSYVSNGVGVYKLVGQYARLLNVDLASTFSTIDEVYGTVDLAKTPFFPGLTVTMPQSPAAWNWRTNGYPGWKTFHNAHPKLTSTEIIDIRFNQNAGIYPGQTVVPKGTHHLYAVSRAQSFDTSKFNLTICGKPATTAVCQTLSYNEAAPWAPASKITLPGFPKKVISMTGSYTVAAVNGKPAETKAIQLPPPNQARTLPFPLSYSNKHIFSLMLPLNSALPPAPGPGYPHYIAVGNAINPNTYLTHGTSLISTSPPTQAPHGNVTGTVTICVQ